MQSEVITVFDPEIQHVIKSLFLGEDIELKKKSLNPIMFSVLLSRVEYVWILTISAVVWTCNNVSRSIQSVISSIVFMYSYFVM